MFWYNKIHPPWVSRIINIYFIKGNDGHLQNPKDQSTSNFGHKTGLAKFNELSTADCKIPSSKYYIPHYLSK